MPRSLLQLKNFFRNNWLACAGIFIFFSCYYVGIILLRIDTDVQPHAFVAYKFAQQPGAITPNFLYFVVVALLAGFSKYKALYYTAAVVIISASLTAKYFTNLFYIKNAGAEGSLTRQQQIFVSASALFIFCLPGLNFFTDKQFLLGQLAPNVWHNSTVTFLFPFAIMLFFELFAFLQKYERKKIALLILLIVINALIKPSFLFTIMPAAAFCVLIFKSNGKLKNILAIAALSVLVISLVVLQYYIIYVFSNNTNGCADCNEGVAIAPFEVWDYYSASMPLAFVSSLLFPLLYLVLSKGFILRDKMVQFAVINWAVAMLIYILFIETGGRKYHGNFGWQMITGNYFLFLVMGFKLFAKKSIENRNVIIYKILKAVYLVHVLWGVFYFVKILWFKNYA